jgi:MraZ protein
MFLGRFEHTIDDKGRMIIPVRYRDLIINGAYITQGFDQNLLVVLAENFERNYLEISQMSSLDPTVRLLREKIFSTAERIEVDRLGRILIPNFLRQHAQLDSRAMVIGAGTNFEIWSPELWEIRDARLSDAKFSSELEKFNLPLL